MTEPTMPGAPVAPPQKSWLSRNWIWALPVGCLGLIGMAAGAIVLLIGFIFGMIKSSDAYQQPLAKAQADPQVRAALGDPVKDTWYVTGNINLVNDGGSANLQIPLSGPKGEGTLYVVATKAQGTWTFQTMLLKPKSGTDINLIKAEKEPEPPAKPSPPPEEKPAAQPEKEEAPEPKT